MNSGIVVSGRGRVALGILLDRSDEESAFTVLIVDALEGTSKPVTLEVSEMAEVRDWLQRALSFPALVERATRRRDAEAP